MANAIVTNWPTVAIDASQALSASTSFDMALPAHTGAWECQFTGTLSVDAAVNLRMNGAGMGAEAFFAVTQAGVGAGASGNCANARDGQVTFIVRTARAAAGSAKTAFVTAASGDAAAALASYGLAVDSGTNALASIGFSVTAGSVTGTFIARKVLET